MRKLSKSKRDSMIVAESNAIAVLFAEYLLKPESYQSGIDALDAYWRKSRPSPIASWIRFYVVISQVELLERMGRLEDAVTASRRLASLPATPYSRVLAAWTRSRVLRRAGRIEEAYLCATTGLRTCAKTQDISVARGLIREIVRLAIPAYLEDLADKYGGLVMDAAKLQGFAEFVGPEVQMPLEALKALEQGMRAQQQVS